MHYEIYVFILKNDQKKINKLNQYLKEKCDHVMPQPAYFHVKLITWKPFLFHNEKFPIVIYCLNTQELQILCVISVGSMATESSLSCIRQVDNWYRNSMHADLLGDLTIIAAQGHTIFILKADMSTPIWASTLAGWWHLHLLLVIDLLGICLFSFTAWKLSKYRVFSGPYFPAFGPNTVKPPYSGHLIWRTPPYNGHFSQERMK